MRTPQYVPTSTVSRPHDPILGRLCPSVDNVDGVDIAILMLISIVGPKLVNYFGQALTCGHNRLKEASPEKQENRDKMYDCTKIVQCLYKDCKNIVQRL